MLRPLWAEPRPKNMCFSRVADFKLHLLREGLSNLAGVSVFGLPKWYLHSPTELDFSFSSQGQGHKVINLENVKKINKLGIELLAFSTVSNESWYASSALRVLQLSSFTFFPIPTS